MEINPLLLTDVYKIGHAEQYPKDITEVYSYLEARKPGKKMIFFGLQYILKEYLSRPITYDNVEEFLKYYKELLGEIPSDVVWKMSFLRQLGYWPVEIKAVAEGSLIDSQNVLLTIHNTLPEFYWCVGFLESLLLKVWNPITVASCSKSFLDLVTKYGEMTCDSLDHIPYQVHDFGYRGVSSEETAAISGASHLLNFKGSDTIVANKFLDDYYGASGQSKASGVHASEHSVMCAYGRENEYDAFDSLLFDIYPAGIVSVVSDSYDYWSILIDYLPSRKERIMNRPGKVVIRPDSGVPESIINGDSSGKGSLQLLWETFGGTINSKGYKVLDPHIGLIYGDGMYYERFERILTEMKRQGFASSNLVVGIGGLLLQNHNRDELGFAIKASRVVRAGVPINVFKDPKTDQSKKSKKGLMSLQRNSAREYFTRDEETEEMETTGFLVPVFRDGKVLKEYTFAEIKSNIKNSEVVNA